MLGYNKTYTSKQHSTFELHSIAHCRCACILIHIMRYKNMHLSLRISILRGFPRLRAPPGRGGEGVFGESSHSPLMFLAMRVFICVA